MASSSTTRPPSPAELWRRRLEKARDTRICASQHGAEIRDRKQRQTNGRVSAVVGRRERRILMFRLDQRDLTCVIDRPRGDHRTTHVASNICDILRRAYTRRASLLSDVTAACCPLFGRRPPPCRRRHLATAKIGYVEFDISVHWRHRSSVSRARKLADVTRCGALDRCFRARRGAFC